MRGDRYLFLMLCVTIWVAIANGAVFCFPLISPALTGAGFSTRDVNIVSTTGAITSYLSLPTGLLYDRFGPRPTLLVGGLAFAVGWLTLALQFHGTLPMSVAGIAVSYGVSQLSASFFESGTVLTNLDAFSLHQGRVIVIQKTYMGFGSSIIAMVYAAFFTQAPIELFILFLGAFGGLMALLGAWLVRLPSAYSELRVSGLNSGCQVAARQYDTPFRVGIALMATMLTFVFATNLINAQITLPASAHIAFGCVALVFSLAFLVLPLLIPKAARPTEEDPDYLVPLSISEPSTVGLGLDVEVTRNTHGLCQNMRRPELWLLWHVCFCTWGAMTLVNSNTAFIYQAIAGDVNKVRNSVYVSVFGIAGALGRIVVGALEPLLAKRGFDVWYLLPLSPALVAFGLLLFLVVGERGLVAPFFIVGLAAGLMWGASVLLIKRLFSRSGQHYAFLYTAGALTPLFFSLFLFTWFFDEESHRQGRHNSSTCTGVSCILWSVVIAAGLNATAIVSAVLLVLRLNSGALLRSGPSPAEP